MKEKHVDGFAVALMFLGIELTGGVDEALEDLWLKVPEKDGGELIKKTAFMALGHRLYDIAKDEVSDMFDGGMPDVDESDLPQPEPEPDPDPGSNIVRIMNTGAQMHCDGIWYDKFVFPRLGPEYTDEPFDLVFADGKKLFVPNPDKMTMVSQGMKYQPGGPFSNNNPDIPTMEVYAWKGTHPDWVEARFRHPVDNAAPDPVEPEPDDGWTTINWGGNPNESSEGRSRLHWTKIHGTTDKWWRKFPLPVWLDDKSYQVDFIFSSGEKFYVPDSRQMAMKPNGPKYLQQVSSEQDKQHPKISEEYGRNETWVKFRIRN